MIFIIAQPINNTLQYGNPFYPVRVAGLNGTELPTSSPIQYISKLPLLANAVGYFVSVTEIDPIVHSKAGWTFQRSWHNHNLVKDGLKAAPGDYKLFAFTGGSNACVP
jgi:hypothetical protein